VGIPSEVHPEPSIREALTMLERRLPDNLVKFLKHAKHVSGGYKERNYFFYNCFGLASPFKIIDYLDKCEETVVFKNPGEQIKTL
jgi:hypothetical protein